MPVHLCNGVIMKFIYLFIKYICIYIMTSGCTVLIFFIMKFFHDGTEAFNIEMGPCKMLSSEI